MPQYRKLQCKIVESLDFNDMPDDFTRLVWALLPLGLDREGRALDSAALVKSHLMPLREDVTNARIATALDWFTTRGMIIRYKVQGRAYFYVPTFHKHQGNTEKEAASNYPEPPEIIDAGPTQELVPTDSDTDAIFNMQYSDANADTDPGAAQNSQIADLETPPIPDDSCRTATPATPAKKAKAKTVKPKATPDPRVHEVLKELESRWGEPIPAPGRQAKAVKGMLLHNRDPIQILACWQLKIDAKGGPWVPLEFVAADMKAFLEGTLPEQRKANGTYQNGSRANANHRQYPGPARKPNTEECGEPEPVERGNLPW